MLLLFVPSYKKSSQVGKRSRSTVRSSPMERAFSGEFQSDCLKVPDHFLLDVVSSLMTTSPAVAICSFTWTPILRGTLLCLGLSFGNSS